METGTVESIVGKKLNKKISGLTGGNGSENGNNGGGNNGDDNLNNPFYSEHEKYVPNKARILMWFLLVVVLMTFGGLMSAYVVIATNGVLEWQPFALPIQIWISTFLILVSSFTYHIAKKAIDNDNQPKSKTYLLITTVLGATFVSSQLLSWFALYQAGIYVQSNPYAGFFYILTAVHAAHVLGGIIALGSIVLKTLRGIKTDEDYLKQKTTAQVVGWYWHFMGGLWIVLFVLLGFYK